MYFFFEKLCYCYFISCCFCSRVVAHLSPSRSVYQKNILTTVRMFYIINHKTTVKIMIMKLRNPKVRQLWTTDYSEFSFFDLSSEKTRLDFLLISWDPKKARGKSPGLPWWQDGLCVRQGGLRRWVARLWCILVVLPHLSRHTILDNSEPW